DEEDGVELVSTDWSSVEIRFGNGLKQKAHRFTVPEGEGAGVPPEDYSYHDYIDIPFQAWDTDNNRQLMISFRDQERDGQFNLIERDIDDEISGREYFFIHAVSYDPATPSDKIAKAGGHTYKQLYFFWPTLPGEKIWDEDSITTAKIVIQYGKYIMINEESPVTVLADYQKNVNLHVDHHEILTLLTDAVNKEFIILEANDGGLGISYNEGKTWEQIKSGYITTQFYGVAKKPYAHEYIGGMQDNGTWQSPGNATASSSSEYDDKIGGDGFEALWHPQYPHRIIGSSYYNRFYVSNDGGETWTRASQGINTNDGPFVSRLSHSRTNPDLIFAVGSKGVFRHNNFGMGRFEWETIEIPVGWSVSNIVTDQHNVEVSLANDSIVWAGAGMYPKPDLHIFLSKNRGLTFDSVPNYKNVKMSYISGIATHPFDKKTAYILFSLKSKPKILRTTDFGKTWEDITGFENNSASNNGFPDVMVYSLLVMPYDNDIIWAGTEIGIFESTDNGATWHYADNGLPAVSIWQMFIQDNHVVAATHGRGIWTLDLSLVNNPEFIAKSAADITIYPNPNKGDFYLELNNEYMGEVSIRIYRLDGKLIYHEQVNKNDMILKNKINLSQIRSGEYIISLAYRDKQISRNFVIQ
ncbi:MAG TPA: T9SS type A sorting domain-containing protein, partial [Bacteroidales bacterium]|nr:T9SS type A sorting domain-containing protein [Bacteroidales bacterium]